MTTLFQVSFDSLQFEETPELLVLQEQIDQHSLELHFNFGGRHKWRCRLKDRDRVNKSWPGFQYLITPYTCQENVETTFQKRPFVVTLQAGAQSILIANSAIEFYTLITGARQYHVRLCDQATDSLYLGTVSFRLYMTESMERMQIQLTRCQLSIPLRTKKQLEEILTMNPSSRLAVELKLVIPSVVASTFPRHPQGDRTGLNYLDLNKLCAGGATTVSDATLTLPDLYLPVAKYAQASAIQVLSIQWNLSLLSVSNEVGASSVEQSRTIVCLTLPLLYRYDTQRPFVRIQETTAVHLSDECMSSSPTTASFSASLQLENGPQYVQMQTGVFSNSRIVSGKFAVGFPTPQKKLWYDSDEGSDEGCGRYSSSQLAMDALWHDISLSPVTMASDSPVIASIKSLHARNWLEFEISSSRISSRRTPRSRGKSISTSNSSTHTPLATSTLLGTPLPYPNPQRSPLSTSSTPLPPIQYPRMLSWWTPAVSSHGNTSIILKARQVLWDRIQSCERDFRAECISLPLYCAQLQFADEQFAQQIQTLGLQIKVNAARRAIVNV